MLFLHFLHNSTHICRHHVILEKLFTIKDRGQTDRVIALLCPYWLDIDF